MTTDCCTAVDHASDVLYILPKRSVCAVVVYIR